MKATIRFAVLAAAMLTLTACQGLRDQKDSVVQAVAAILIGPVIDAQSADARQGEGQPAAKEPRRDCGAATAAEPALL